MQITVLLLGPAADAAGARSLTISLDGGATVAELMERLARERPEIAGIVRAGRIAVNHAYKEGAHVIRSGDEVALISLVGGG